MTTTAARVRCLLRGHRWLRPIHTTDGRMLYVCDRCGNARWTR